MTTYTDKLPGNVAALCTLSYANRDEYKCEMVPTDEIRRLRRIEAAACAMAGYPGGALMCDREMENVFVPMDKFNDLCAALKP